MDSKKKKFLLILSVGFVAVALGSFLAFSKYFGHMVSHSADITFASSIAEDSMKEQKKLFDDFSKQFDPQLDPQFKPLFKPQFKFFSSENHSPSSIIQVSNLNMTDANFVNIKSEDNKDFYKIMIDLKPFNNDEKNIKIHAKGNRLDISAKYESKDKQVSNSVYAYQSISLPDKMDVSKMIQKNEKGILVYIIPKKGK